MDYELKEIEKYCERLYCFEEITSTNRIALATENAPNKSVFLAKTQTEGRGRLGRSWICDDGGIYMTVLIKPKEIAESFSQITLVCAVAVARVIKNSQIKWPNDIILDNKKVCGILTESTISGKNSAKIAVGIGINANNTAFSNELSDKATSIYLQTNKNQDKTKIVADVLKEFWDLYESFLNKGFSVIKDEYLKKSATIGKEIVIIRNDKKMSGKAMGITEFGELEAMIDGKKVTLNAGEVSVRGLLGYLQ